METCSICSLGGSFPYNQLLICSKCCIPAHSLCYGIFIQPTFPWLCQKCAAGEKEVTCQLCPQRQGAFIRTVTGVWVHVICALFVPEVQFCNRNEMDAVILPHENSFINLFAKACNICERVEGVCRRCDFIDCDLHFHVTCGQVFGLLVIESQEGHKLKFAAYCLNHKDTLEISELKQPMPENTSLLEVEDIKTERSCARRIVNKLMYKVSKNLAMTCPFEGLKGYDVNTWFKTGFDKWLSSCPNLNETDVINTLRKLGLGYYHNCLKRLKKKCNLDRKLYLPSEEQEDDDSSPLQDAQKLWAEDVRRRTLYLKGFPLNATSQDIMPFLSSAAPFENLVYKLYRNGHSHCGKFKGSLFVTYRSEVDAFNTLVMVKKTDKFEKKLIVKTHEEYMKLKEKLYLTVDLSDNDDFPEIKEDGHKAQSRDKIIIRNGREKLHFGGMLGRMGLISVGPSSFGRGRLRNHANKLGSRWKRSVDSQLSYLDVQNAKRELCNDSDQNVQSIKEEFVTNDEKY